MSLRDHRTLHLLALSVLGCVVLLPELSEDKRMNGREARHAEIAREMVQTGEYVVPRSLGHPYIDKPPLFHWVAAAVFRLTGRVDIGTARLPSALAGIAAALAIYLLGRHWLSARAGLWSAVIWLTFQTVVEWSHMARMDMLMSCLNLYALLLATWAAGSRRGWSSWALWCGSSLLATAAVMTKGPQSIFFFVVGVIAVWRAHRGRWSPPAGFVVTWLVLLVVVVASWLAACEYENPGHIRRLVRYEFGAGISEHAKPLYLYAEQIPIRTLPWFLFVAGAVYAACRRARRSGYDRTLIPVVFCVAAFVGLTVMPSKRPHYALPALPMWALLVGMFLDRSAGAASRADDTSSVERDAREGEARWLFTWPLKGWLIVSVVAAVVFPAVFWARIPDRTLLLVLCVGVGALSAFGVFAAFRQHTVSAVRALLATSLVVAAVTMPVRNHWFWEAKDRVVVSREVARILPHDAAVAGYRLPATPVFETLFFRINRPALFLQTEEELRSFLRSQRPCCVVLRTEEAEGVRRLAPGALREMGTWLIDEEKGRRITVLVTGKGV